MKSEIKIEDESVEANTNTKKKDKQFSEEKQKMLQTEKVWKMRSLFAQTKSLTTELFQVNHIRNKLHINVHGASPPDPIETFDQLINDCGIPQQIVNNLISCGYKEPTPIQMQAIPIMTSVS